MAATPAAAQPLFDRLAPLGLLGPIEAAIAAALVGTTFFAFAAGAAALRGRRRAASEARLTAKTLADIRARLDRAEGLLEADDQITAVIEDGGQPVVNGRLPAHAGVPTRGNLLAFGLWLEPGSAARLEACLQALKRGGTPFSEAVTSRTGAALLVTGRTLGSRLVLRLREAAGLPAGPAGPAEAAAALEGAAAAMRALLSALPHPVWIRREGVLEWVNEAYARAVEAESPEDALARRLEFLDTPDREALAAALREAGAAERRVAAIAAGRRRSFDVVEIACGDASAGHAIDVSDLEEARAALRRATEFHARTLDQLATAVASFGPDRKLTFYNAAYRALFDLDPAFLDSEPDESALLDLLRANRRIPEQADYRAWKARILDIHRSVEAQEFAWHLPDGRSIRAIANPQPQGGVTWIYENVTERLELESRYRALLRVQGETLDHLAEGVATFGPDGRLRLSNPALARLFGLDPARLSERPHVSEFVAEIARVFGEAEVLTALAETVTGVRERRETVSGRLERADGAVIDVAGVPLPDGGTLAAFVDVSASVAVERALTERNEALETATRVKNDFVQHVSYELRSPLTNIIGFAHLIADGRTGPLNERQREYLDHILSSSSALLALINDILDLATLDAGIVELELGEVDLVETVAAAAEGLNDRLAEADINLEVMIDSDAARLTADARRLRQILFNLLSNAVAHSRKGGRITVGARREGDDIVISVADEGEGMPPEFVAEAFERFSNRRSTTGKGGAGVGLALVRSFVELQGGEVGIESEEGRGTTVTCRLPVRPRR